MTLSDHIVFWERHRQRPPLCSSIAVGAGKREVMLDDGRIAWVKQPTVREMAEPMIEQLRLAREQNTKTLASFGKGAFRRKL